MWYVYLVLCKNNSIYTGVTDDINARFKRHRAGTGGWHTKLYPAIELLRIEKFETKQEALKRERQIKGWRREKKINLIKFGKPVLILSQRTCPERSRRSIEGDRSRLKYISHLIHERH